jgi:hypothetical protein
MHTPAIAKASGREFNPRQHEAFDHDYGNDELDQFVRWGHHDSAPSIATSEPLGHRSVDLFDHHHGWEECGGGHQPHQGAANSAAPQDGLIAVIGGSAAAAGDASAVSGFVENLAEDKEGYSIAMGEALFQAAAHSARPGDTVAAASTFLDVSGADFIIEHETGQLKQRPNDAWAFSEFDYFAIDIDGWSPRHGPIVIELDQSFGHHQPIAHELSYGNFAQVLALAEVHGTNTLSDTLANALTVENHFSFVNAIAMVAL